MPENLESNSPEGSAGSPNSSASQGTSDKPPSTFDASKLPEQLESLVSKAVEKAVQSTKDKRFSNIEKTLDDFKPVMEQVKAMLTPEQLKEFNQIQKDAEFEELKRRVYGDPSTSTPAVGNQKSAATFDPQSVLQEFQLDGNDIEVVTQVLSKTNEVDAIRAAASLALKRAKPTTASPAASMALTGRPAQLENVDEKILKLQKLQKEPTKNWAEIKKLEGELGWDK